MSDIKRIQSLLGRLGSACERLEVLPRARTELSTVDEPGLELCLLWLEMLENSGPGGELRPFLAGIAEALSAEAVVVLTRDPQGGVGVVGDWELALGHEARHEKVRVFLDDLCERRFTTNLDRERIVAVLPETDVVALLGVPLRASHLKSVGMFLATRRRGSLTRRSFNERERLALTVAATAYGLMLSS